MFFKIGFLENFTNYKGELHKLRRWSFFLIKSIYLGTNLFPLEFEVFDGSLRNALKSDLIGWKRRISHNCFLGDIYCTEDVQCKAFLFCIFPYLE